MKLVFASLVFGLASISVGVVGCAPAAPPPAPTAAAVAPAKAVEPTKPVEPTKVAEPKAAVAPTAAPASNVDFPSKGKAINVIVPWAAGGATDIGARMVAAGLEKELGTPVQVVNRDGGGSQTGLTELTKAKPDGYTLGITNLPTSIIIYLDAERKAAFSRKDFQPVANYVSDPVVLAVKGDSKFKTLKDLLDEAKANPGKLTIGTTGLLGVSHLPLLTLQTMAGVKFAIVDIGSGVAQSTAMLGGHVDAGSATAGNWTSLVRSGQLRYLTIHDSQESKSFPGVKTTDSQGYKIYAAASHGFSAPGGTPKEIVAILSGAIKKIVDGEDFKKKMDDLALPLSYTDTARTEAYWDQVERDIAPVLKQAREEQKSS